MDKLQQIKRNMDKVIAELDTMLDKSDPTILIHKGEEGQVIYSELVHLSEADGVQIYRCSQNGNTECPAHIHPNSHETFICLTGQVEVAGSLLKEGEAVHVSPGVPHGPKAHTDTTYLAILHPLEREYL